MVFVKIMLLIALTRILNITKKPLVCSSIYTIVFFLFSLLSDKPLLPKIIASAIVMATSSLYFWLLNYFDDNLALYWLVMILGLAIGLV